jgi:hypothetical protein
MMLSRIPRVIDFKVKTLLQPNHQNWLSARPDLWATE